MIGRVAFLAPVLSMGRFKLRYSKLAMSPSSTAHGAQYDTGCMTFELLSHAAFVAVEIRSDVLEPGRITGGHS